MLSNLNEVTQLLRKITEIISRETYSTSYEKKIWTNVVPKLLGRLCRALEEKDLLQIALYSKLIVEYLAQIKYLRDRYNNDDEKFFSDLRKRTRRGQSFSIRMITDAKNVPGPIKRKILNVYLYFAQFVHPSENLTSYLVASSGNLPVDLICYLSRLLDVILYLYMLMYGIRDSLCDLCVRGSFEMCSKRCR